MKTAHRENATLEEEDEGGREEEENEEKPRGKNKDVEKQTQNFKMKRTKI